MTEPLRIWVGWDDREATAYHVFASSLIRRASRPISISPLVQPQLRAAGLYWRAPDAKASTSFSLTRFLVPCLADYTGLALFCDCDMLALADVWELVDLAYAQPDKALFVCPHDYAPKRAVKMDGQPNAAYPRKNQSSLMLLRCGTPECQRLTTDYVNTATPAELHRFAWCEDGRIGSLPLEWNWLCDEYPHNDAAKILHFTEGGPWFPEHHDCDHSDDWLDEFRLTLPAHARMNAVASLAFPSSFVAAHG